MMATSLRHHHHQHYASAVSPLHHQHQRKVLSSSPSSSDSGASGCGGSSSTTPSTTTTTTKHPQREAPAPGSFPDSFREFFATTLDEDGEDGCAPDRLATMLEDKLIPRRRRSRDDEGSAGGGGRGGERGERGERGGGGGGGSGGEIGEATTPPRRSSCRRAMSVRTFQRRASEVHYRSRRRLSCSQQHQHHQQLQQLHQLQLQRRPDEDDADVSPERDRRRSTSLAAGDVKRHTLLHADHDQHQPYESHHRSSDSGRSPGVSPARSPKPRGRTSSVPLQRPMLANTRRAALHAGSEAGLDVEYYRLRSFSITAHGVSNLGDSLRSRRSRSISSVTSSGSAASARDRLDSTGSQTPVPQQDDQTQGPYRVAMLGASGVGKTALTCQFTTSEYICAYDASLDEEYGQKNVSVLLNGQETELEIIDHPASEMSVESFCATYNADVFVVVYSVEDRQSLKSAEDILLYLWKGEYMMSRGVILVANKADLERKREIPMVVGRRLANNYGCKFIEASSGIAHNVDELLVGILAQVKLNPQRGAGSRRRRKQRLGGGGGGVRLQTAPRLLARLLGLRRRAKSCENLFVI